MGRLDECSMSHQYVCCVCLSAQRDVMFDVVLTDLSDSSEEQFDSLTLSNVVPMYPQFKSQCHTHTHARLCCFEMELMVVCL